MSKKLFISILVAFTLVGCQQNLESNEILFVCTHGAARSPIAAAHFNKLAKEKDLNFHAVFRGTEPNESLSKETVEGLTEEGFSVNEWIPEKVTTQDVAKAYRIVTFDCDVPSEDHGSSVIEWNGTPSISKDYDVASEVIKSHVEQLIEDLSDVNNG